MASVEQVLVLPYEVRKTFNNWQQVKDIYEASCYCTAINTDMEETIEVEALHEKCLNDLCYKYTEIGFVYYLMPSRALRRG